MVNTSWKTAVYVKAYVIPRHNFKIKKQGQTLLQNSSEAPVVKTEAIKIQTADTENILLRWLT